MKRGRLEEEYKERLKQEGSFADKHPELLAEWDYNKNHKGPNEYLEGSNQAVYWVCSKCGYKWSARISHRSSGSGCKKCAIELGKKTLLSNLILQKGSLADNAPQLAEEWHPTKNGTVKPNDVMLNTNKSFWWKCGKCGYEWETSPSNRNIGRGCPKCALELQKCNMMKPILGENDLLSQCPELAQEWHPYKNGELTPKDVTKSANRKVWWLGKCGHEWETVVGSRYLGRGCPICRKEFKVSYPEKAIYYYLNKYCHSMQVIENYTAEWLQGKEIDIFIPSLNFGIEYDGENWHKNIDTDREKDLLCISNNVELLRIRESKAPRISSKNTFIIENPNDNEIELIKAIEFVFSFLKRNFDIDIQYEIDLKNDRTHIYELLELSKKEKSLLFLYPSIAMEWHPTKNGYLTPEYISAHSHKTFWWMCPKGHEYDMVVKHRVEKASQCPICSNHRVLKGYNDLTTTRPDMAQEWHPLLNGDLKPEHVTEFSNKKVWWQCSKGHSYQRTVANRAISEVCPICSGRQLLLGVNDLVTLNKDIATEWCYEKNGEMSPEQFTAITYKSVWWKCSKCSHEWNIPIRSRYLLGHGCPKCAGEKRWEKRKKQY